MRRSLFSAAALVSMIGLALFIYGFSTPSSETRKTGGGEPIDTRGLNPIDQASFKVATGTHYVRHITLTQNISLLASVKVLDPQYRCIDFYIMDDVNYAKWLETGNASKYVSVQVDLEGDFRFNVDHEGVFYFVFDDRQMSHPKPVTFELFDITGLDRSVDGDETGQSMGEGSQSLKRLNGGSGAAVLMVGLILMAYAFVKEPHPKLENMRAENTRTD